MAEEEDTDRPTEEFYLQQMCCLRVFNTPKQLPTNVSNLLCTSNTYGLIFVGLGQELKVIDVAPIEKIPSREDFSPSDPTKDFPCRTFCTEQEITHLALNADSSLLGVVCRGNGTLDLGVVNLQALLGQGANNQLQFSASLELLRMEGAGMKILQFHPSLPNLVAVCLSNGKVSLLEVTKDKVTEKVTWKGQLPINAIYWSPKGKSLILGQSDGKLLKCDKALECKKEVPLPDLFGGQPQQVRYLHWISTFQVGVTYKGLDPDSEAQFVIVTSQRDGPTNFQSFGDIYFGFGEDRQLTYYSCDIPEWSVICKAASNSFVLVVLGAVDGKWFKWTLKDSGNADLPLNENHEETFPLGLAINLNSTLQIKEGENTLSPTPLLMTLSTDGVLSFFHMVNKFPHAKLDILKEAQKLPMIVAPLSNAQSQAPTPKLQGSSRSDPASIFSFPKAMPKSDVISVPQNIAGNQALQQHPSLTVEGLQKASPFSFVTPSKPVAELSFSKSNEVTQTEPAVGQAPEAFPTPKKNAIAFGGFGSTESPQTGMVPPNVVISSSSTPIVAALSKATPSFSFPTSSALIGGPSASASAFGGGMLGATSTAAPPTTVVQSSALFGGFSSSSSLFGAPTSRPGFISSAKPATPASSGSRLEGPASTTPSFSDNMSRAASSSSIVPSMSAPTSSSSAPSDSLFGTIGSGSTEPLSGSSQTSSLFGGSSFKGTIASGSSPFIGYTPAQPASGSSSFPVFGSASTQNSAAAAMPLGAKESIPVVSLPTPAVVSLPASVTNQSLNNAEKLSKGFSAGTGVQVPTVGPPTVAAASAMKTVTLPPATKLSSTFGSNPPVGSAISAPSSVAPTSMSSPGNVSTGGLLGKQPTAVTEERQTPYPAKIMPVKQVSAENKDSKAKQKLLDETVLVDQEIIKMIKTEIEGISKEIKAQRLSQRELHSTVDSIGTREETRKLKRDTSDILSMVKILKQHSKDQDKTISSMKAKMLGSFDRLQDMQGVFDKTYDPRHVSLLKLKPLDSETEHQRKEIHKNFNAVESLISDVTVALDIAWEKKMAQRDQRRTSMKCNNSHNLYRSMDTINKITNNLATRVESLSRNVRHMKLDGNRLLSEEPRGNESFSHFDPDDSISKGNRRPSANASVVGNISASKNAKLRSFLMHRPRTPIRRSKHFGSEIRYIGADMKKQEMGEKSKQTSQAPTANLMQRKIQQNTPSAPPNTPSVPRSTAPSLSIISLRQKLESEAQINSAKDVPAVRLSDGRLESQAINDKPQDIGFKGQIATSVLPTTAVNISSLPFASSFATAKAPAGKDFGISVGLAGVKSTITKPIDKERELCNGKENKDKFPANQSSESSKIDGTAPLSSTLNMRSAPIQNKNEEAESRGIASRDAFALSATKPSSDISGSAKLESSSFSLLPPNYASTPLVGKGEQKKAADMLVGTLPFAFQKDNSLSGIGTPNQEIVTASALGKSSMSSSEKSIESGESAIENRVGDLTEKQKQGIPSQSNPVEAKPSEKVATVSDLQASQLGTASAPHLASTQITTSLSFGKATGGGTGVFAPTLSSSSDGNKAVVKETTTEPAKFQWFQSTVSTSFVPASQTAVAQSSGLPIGNTCSTAPNISVASLSSTNLFAPKQTTSSGATTANVESTSVTVSASPSTGASDNKAVTFSSSGTTSSPFGFSATSATAQISASVATSQTLGTPSLFGSIPTAGQTVTSSITATSASTHASAAPTGSTSSAPPLFGSSATTTSSVPVFPAKPFSSVVTTSQDVKSTTVATAQMSTTSQEFGFGFSTPTTTSSTGAFGSGFGFSGQSFPATSTSSKQENSGGLFQGFGLGGKPNDPGRNPFGNAPTVDQQASKPSPFGTSQGSSSIGFQQPSGFGSSSSGFGTDSGGVGSSGFGGGPTFGGAPAFGGAPSFGGSPAFGGAPTFGGSPTFGGTAFAGGSPPFGSNATFGSGSTFGSAATFGSATPSQGTVFGQSASGSPSFGQLAAQDNQAPFGGNSGGFSSFGTLAQQSSSFGSSSPSGSSFSTWR